MNYEQKVAFLGSWGPFQRRVFCVLCASAFPSGFAVLWSIIVLSTPAHNCYIPPSANISQGWTSLSQQGQSSCSRYALDLALNASLHGLRPGLGNASGSEVTLGELPLEECHDGMSFSQQYFTSTVVTEFSLVCDDQWKQPLSSQVYFLGGLCGCIVCGQLSDRFGRKPVLFGALLLQSVFSSVTAFAPSWPVFTFFFFMVGLGQATAYLIAFVLGSELLTGGTRELFSCFGLPFGYTLGSMMLPGVAYLLPNWRHLTSATAASSIACLPLWWAVPESPRWLLSQGYTKKAEGILLSAASANRAQAPASIFCTKQLETHAVAKGTFLDLLETRNIRHVTLMLLLIWLFSNASYYSLSFCTSGLVGSPFVNYFLISLIDVPAYFFSWVAARYCRRRVAFMLFGSLGIVALLFTITTTDAYPKATLCLVLLAKLGVLAGMSITYIHSGELYPTIIRSTAMSSCAMFGRVGSSLSPYLHALAAVKPALPWLLVAALTFLSVLLISFLPETFQEPLPDAIEQIAKPQSLIFRCCSTSSEKINSQPLEISKPPPAPAAPLVSGSDPVIICTTRL